MERLPDSILHRYVSVTHIAFKRATSHAVGIFLFSCRRLESISAQQGIGGTEVKIRDTLDCRIGNSHCAVVSDHGGCVASPAREYRHPTSLLPFGDETPHHFSAQTRFYECKQRVQSPVGVPHAEIVIIISRVHLHYLLTTGKTGITAVNIIDYAGQKRAPVERPVEFGTVIPSPALDFDSSEPFVPQCRRPFSHLVEIQLRHFGIQIGSGSLQ